ncbi:hypothetical protein GCM10022226_10260 [Sphaerisporangium flaviroseum]|uniref:Uncharacterized protein n=1 Tax=Sphaerisporangium flaviroseum TaxID=509199 RepID=A0ABP7HJ65_9ACTN
MMALGIEVWRQGESRGADRLEKESLRFNSSLADWLGMGANMEVLAWIAASEGDHERAARLLGILAEVWRTVGTPLSGGAGPKTQGGAGRPEGTGWEARRGGSEDPRGSRQARGDGPAHPGEKGKFSRAATPQ